jgi:hypothetical protein
MKNPRRAVLIVLGLWLVVILAVTIRGMLAPHQNTVFLVFREAGGAWVAAQPLYAQVGKYLYSPLAAAFFAPFSLMPDWAGSGLWRLVTGLAYLFAVVSWFRREERELVPTGLGLLLLLPLSIGNLNNGQASPLIIALLVCGCLAFLDERRTLAAACISVAAFFKIYPLAIGLLLVVIEPRKMGWRLILGILILGALSLVLQRPDYVVSQYRDWWRSLGQDQRRVSTELGSWRDAWLLLQIVHFPITAAGYAVLQAIAALAAAFFCWQRSKVWDRPAVTWFAFAIGCLWITLFGPSTELATYIFLAPAVAFTCAWVLWPMVSGGQPVRQLLPIAAYGLLLLAEALNAWVPVIRQNNYLHAIQPVGALLFLGFVIGCNPLPFSGGSGYAPR